jgi:hypothetical protein
MVRKKIGWDGMKWFEPAEDSDKWQAFVNTVMKPAFP